MAEQVINTVYALAEQPDIFCDKLIKTLTKRAFAPKKAASQQPSQPSEDTDGEKPDPDAMAVDEEGSDPSQSDKPASQAGGSEDKDVGDAFELSQLLFVVGHVAIKHIVFLELVEREWKRQKHEREQGMWSRLVSFYHLI